MMKWFYTVEGSYFIFTNVGMWFLHGIQRVSSSVGLTSGKIKGKCNSFLP